MSTATVARPVVGGSSLNRIVAVVKLQFTNPWGVLIFPWIIMLIILAMNIAIWWIIVANAQSDAARADIREGFAYSGAGSYIFVYMLVVAVQAINGYFPFALGYSVTRRNYYLGVTAFFVILSAIFTVGMSLLGAIEEATDGWGLGGRMFTAAYFGEDWVQRGFAYFTLLLFFFFVGSTVAAIYVRYKATGMTLFWIGLSVALIGLGALFTLTNSWGAVGEWFANAGLMGSYAWSLVLTAVAAISGFLVLRRATPKG